MTVQKNRGFFGSFVFEDNGLILENPASTFTYTFQAAAFISNQILTIPVLGGNRTFAFLEEAQTFTANQVFAQIRPSSNNTFSCGTNATKWTFIYAAQGMQILANNYAYQVANNSGSGEFFNSTPGERGIELHSAGTTIHKFWLGASSDDGAFYHLPMTAAPGNATAQGTAYVSDNTAGDSWLNLRSNGVWTGVEQRETITVTPGATVTLTHHEFTNVYSTWTAGENETINASGTQIAGQRMDLLIECDGTPRTITFGTNFRANGAAVLTASLGATFYFVSNGTDWCEVARTIGI